MSQTGRDVPLWTQETRMYMVSPLGVDIVSNIRL